MTDADFLAMQFETHRPHLRKVAYRMLGSLTEADDAVQEAWLRLSRSDASEIENLRAWLTTVVARVSLNALRARNTRAEAPLDEIYVPDPLITSDVDPEHEALLADSVGLALLVVLETLTPAERLAFVLHDMFAMPFDEIAPMVGRTSTATRQLASRARRRVQGEAPAPTEDLPRQREVVDAFFAAAREGDFDALVAVLHPDAILRADGADGSEVRRGAQQIARNAMRFAHLAPHVRPVLVNGGPGIVVAPEGKVVTVMAFTVVDGRIAAIDAIADPGRLSYVEL
ncbi:sigma-70 family RNA polymerase sigma factor [Solirubrobacter soli]|uniref:sigma-70 family RNA polymerase sigma factor n=1 Tax=Solirubrobacter soli TaxID=363832 RepID=UPI00041C9737|nr:sigma-70 family RNA polymerase sigma factor [Solirubrobacter soli]